MVTSGKSQHPAVGSTEIQKGSCPGLPSFGEQPVQMKSQGYNYLYKGCTRLWVGLDRNHRGMRNAEFHPFNPIGNDN